MITSTASRPRTAAALTARRRTAEAALQRVHDALGRLRREKTQASVAAVARRAAVCRTFIYNNAEARTAVAAAMTEAGQHRVQLMAAKTTNAKRPGGNGP